MHLGLAEWVVLAVLDERPAHGFAIAALTADDAELGRIWQLPRPVVYRALNRLHEAGLIRPEAIESEAGPQRTVYAATPAGRARAAEWLSAPVRHVREMRSQFLLKLALLQRRKDDPAPLLARQHETLTAIAAGLDAEVAPAAGFDTIMLDWRRSTTRAALEFVEGLEPRYSSKT
ncbi:PadR family transcriptional regulator [Pseudonocardia sp. DLS-67]